MINHIVTSTILVLFLLLLSVVLEKRINPCLKYALWLLVVIKLLIPLPEFETPISVLNLINHSAHFSSSFSKTAPSYNNSIDDKTNSININPNNIGAKSGSISAKPAVPQQNSDQNGLRAFRSNDFNKNLCETSSEKTSSEKAPSLATPFQTLTIILTILWIGGILLCGGIFLWSALRFRKWLRHNRNLVGSYKDKLSIYETDGLDTPCLIGVFAPAIYINRTHPFDREQLSYILEHEYTHFRHRDHIWAVVRCICVSIYWYNPFVWLAAHRSACDGELACDAGTLKRIGTTHHIQYAKTLIIAAENQSQSANIHLAGFRTGATGGMKEMKRRIHLLKNKPCTRFRTLAVTLVLCGGIVGCTYGSATSSTRGDTQISPDLAETATSAAQASNAQTDSPITDSQINSMPNTDLASNTEIETKTELESASEPESDSSENMVYHGITLYHAPEPDKICIIVQPSVVRDYRDYYYIPTGDAQNRLKSLITHMEPEWQKNSDQSIIAEKNLKETGYQLYYDNRVYMVFEGGWLYASGVDEERGVVESCVRNEALCDLVQQLLSENLGYEPVDITQIHDIVSAKLDVRSLFTDWKFYSQTITDQDTLALFEDWFRNATYIKGGADCGNQCACLELTLSDGNVIRLSMATDSCSDFGVNGVYYDYRPKSSWDNAAFFQLFDEIPWRY
ncbi:MAG: M56 family metallopeptidase [Lachnospiraceae bacterium]